MVSVKPYKSLSSQQDLKLPLSVCWSGYCLLSFVLFQYKELVDSFINIRYIYKCL